MEGSRQTRNRKSRRPIDSTGGHPRRALPRRGAIEPRRGREQRSWRGSVRQWGRRAREPCQPSKDRATHEPARSRKPPGPPPCTPPPPPPPRGGPPPPPPPPQPPPLHWGSTPGSTPPPLGVHPPSTGGYQWIGSSKRCREGPAPPSSGRRGSNPGGLETARRASGVHGEPPACTEILRRAPMCLGVLRRTAGLLRGSFPSRSTMRP
jgi:hypothetical protein